MAAGKYNIDIEQGATWRKRFNVDVEGTPYDFTGCIVRMQARAKHTSDDVLVQKTTVDASITTGAGYFDVEFTDEESALWDWRKAVYDVEIETPSGDVTRLLEGTITVSPEVTR